MSNIVTKHNEYQIVTAWAESASGLGRAVLRVGRKVLVDVEQFERWLSVL